MNIASYILLGLAAGVLSGLLGIGGGMLLVPVMIYIFGLSQHGAQGTTLALMVPPIGLLAAWTYYKHGHVNLVMAAFICLGFFVGGFLGAKMAIVLPHSILRKAFGVAMLTVAVHMIFTK